MGHKAIIFTGVRAIQELHDFVNSNYIRVIYIHHDSNQTILIYDSII